MKNFLLPTEVDMKRIAILSVLAGASILASPHPTKAQTMDNSLGRSPGRLSGDTHTPDSSVAVFYPPVEVPPKTCVYNNVIHSAGARICVGYDLATCTETGTWDISEKGARDAPRCNR
jgi:hypothetical protein